MSQELRLDPTPKVATCLLVALLAARLLLGFAYSALNPLGEAPDEADHYAYAAYVAREGHLPVGPMMTQGKHPPLYYLLSAGVIKLLDADPDFSFLRSNPDGGVGPAAAPNFFVHTGLEAWPWRGGALAMHLARLVSVIAGVILTAATYALGRAVWPNWYGGPLAAAALVAFLPETLFVGGSVSNDLLAAMWSTLALWLGLRKGRLPTALGAGLCLGLAVVTKASTASLAPVVAGTMLVQDLLDNRRARTAASESLGQALWRALGRVALTGMVTLLVVAPWLGRNWQLYGDPLGWQIVLGTIDRRQGLLVLVDLAWLARGWFTSFWGKFGAAGHLRLPWLFYLVWGALVAFGLTGWLVAALRRNRRRLPAPSPAAWVTLLGAPVMTILAIVSYSRIALGTDQGRLLFPAVAPIALLIAGGLAAWLPSRAARIFPAIMFGGLGLIAALALVAGIIPFAPPAPPSAAELATATPEGERFGDELELVGLRWDAPARAPGTRGDHPGDVTRLTLYWWALGPVAEDLRAVVRLSDGGDNLLWEAKRSPGAGRFSTDRWPSGRIVRDVYLMPAPALSGAVRVDLGVQPFPDGDWLPVAGKDDLQRLPLSTPPGAR